VRWFDDVRPALQRLAAHGPLLSLSNGNADLQATGLAPWFVGAVSARAVGVAKPDARIFGVACERLGMAPQQVMHIGDDWQADIVGARRAGLHSAWVRRSHPELAPHAAASPAGAEADVTPVDGHHVEVEDLLQLADWLDRLEPGAA
jgi:FMN phosphatase YigB (HAD superfamily)